ncbi:MAG: metalloenzyme [SAR324 cluster bacterium]|uniref:Metalloenzyme n=1 Tax=SAR324 cluster bacterium TaxID=2024889 RepID=A0A7X9FSY7_9DELT|nr:metalloenzyme [SAR324 cluster bacterium]
MKNNFIWIVFDSCRFDSFLEAKRPNISRLGEVERRYSYASWTVPSHAVYMMGVSPHKSPKGVFASEVYKEDFFNWSTRLNIPDISFRGFVPQLSLPAFLKSQGYETNALMSLPVLNQTTIINNNFDRYELMDAHNDFSAILDKLYFESSVPSFYFLNLGETHYPYTVAGEKADNLPKLHGVHGVFKHMDDLVSEDEAKQLKKSADDFFNMGILKELKDKQRLNVEYLDSLFERLYQIVPQNTHILVTSDHGELFGEDGYFGHGPIMHEKVFEVFFVEGMRP